MGEGKTEAAMYLADHWASVDGLSMAATLRCRRRPPATRCSAGCARSWSGRFDEETVQMQLLHGHASLSAEFQRLRQNGSRVLSHPAMAMRQRTTGNGAARLWRQSGSPTESVGLLSPFGVGTIDQALLAALQTRHFFRAPVRTLAIRRSS